MVRNKEVKAVQEMADPIQNGDRELVTKQCSIETLPTRFDDMYEVITSLLEEQHGNAAKVVTDSEAEAAQATDPYCRQMRRILEGKCTRVAGEDLYAQYK